MIKIKVIVSIIEHQSNMMAYPSYEGVNDRSHSLT